MSNIHLAKKFVTIFEKTQLLKKYKNKYIKPETISAF